jgi:NAD(P)H-quinone oxidoreductase subunit 4L
MLEHTLILAAYLFCIGIYGLITSRNMVRALMCLELMLNGVNVNLVAFSNYLDPVEIKGQTFAIFIIAIAALVWLLYLIYIVTEILFVLISLIY